MEVFVRSVFDGWEILWRRLWGRTSDITCSGSCLEFFGSNGAKSSSAVIKV